MARFQVRLYTFAPAEKFSAYLHLAVWTGIAAAAPFCCLQAALFIWPGLRGRERRYAAITLIAVPLLFFAGAAAAYRLISPLVFGFFLSFAAGDGVTALWGLRQYLGLLAGMMFAAGLLMQMPIVLLLLFATGLVSPASCARARPQIVLLIFLIAAVTTPPDVVSQIALGVPLYLLFEATLFAGRLITRKKHDRARGAHPKSLN